MKKWKTRSVDRSSVISPRSESEVHIDEIGASERRRRLREKNMFLCGRFASATLSLLAVVLTVHGACSPCSAFAPQQRSYPSPVRPERAGVGTCFHGPLAAPANKIQPATTSSSIICITSSLMFGSAASDDKISDVGSSVAQTFLADQEDSGRVLTKYDQKWWTRFGELEEYKREHGDCNVPTTANKPTPPLGRWVSNQRQKCKQNKLSAERIEALESIGFEWGRHAEWAERVHELEEYKKEYGDCRVPRNYAANKPLANWVMSQRTAYWKKSSGISAERIDALNNIGFEWRFRNWDERYDELVAYKQTHGNTLVPMAATRDATNKYYGLARWVMGQRKQYRLRQERKHSHLTNDRLKKLNGIGFVWNALDAAWENHFSKLQEFKANHGPTDVPTARENKELYSWAARQRIYYKDFQRGNPSHITNERIEKLKAIGFEYPFTFC